MTKLTAKLVTHKSPTGEEVQYKGFLTYICIMLTIIVFLLAKEFGWLALIFG